MKETNTPAALHTYKLNNGVTVLGKLHKGKVHPMTFSNNLQAEVQQVLTAATGVQCSVHIPAASRIRYIRIN
jgi:hypothetical protein